MSDCPGPLIVAFIVLFSFVLTAILAGISLIVRYAWSWIDEGEMVYCPLIRAGAFLNGYQTYGHYNYYSSKQKAEDFGSGRSQCDFFGILLLQFSALGLIVGMVIVYPLVSLVIGSVVALAFLTRFTRRLSKAYLKHVEDKNAHKG